MFSPSQMKVCFFIFRLVSGSLGSAIPNLSGLLWAFSAQWIHAALDFSGLCLGPLGSPIPYLDFWGPQIGFLESLSVLVGVFTAVSSGSSALGSAPYAGNF